MKKNFETDGNNDKAMDEKKEWVANPAYEYEDQDINILLNIQVSLLQPTYSNTLFDVLGAMSNVHPEHISHALQKRLAQLRTGPSFTQYHLLLPYNLGNYHWVGLIITLNLAFQPITAQYSDSLPRQKTIPKALIKELQKVWPQLTLKSVDLFKQSDMKACGVLMVDNLMEMAYPQQDVLFPSMLSAEDILEKRKAHLTLLHTHRREYFETFYLRQRDNRSSALAIPEQLEFLCQDIKFSLQEWQRLIKLEKLLTQLSTPLQQMLKAAFQDKAEYAYEVGLHIQAIKTGLNTVLSNSSLLAQDKNILYQMIALLSSLEVPEEIALTDISDLDLTITHEELRALGRLPQGYDPHVIKTFSEAIEKQIQDDAKYPFQLQAEDYGSPTHLNPLRGSEIILQPEVQAMKISSEHRPPSSSALSILPHLTFQLMQDLILSSKGVSALIGADWEAKPLLRVIGYGGMLEVKNILKHGSDEQIQVTDARGNTGLHQVILLGRMTLLDLYVERNLLSEERNVWGMTPLHCAILAGQAEMVTTLLNAGASPYESLTLPLSPTLMVSLKAMNLAMYLGNPAVIRALYRALVAKHALNDALLHDTLGYPLHIALLSPQGNTLDFLLTNPELRNWAKGFLERPNTAGQTSLALAAHWGQTLALKTLVYHQADVNGRHNAQGRTALHYAVEGQKSHAVHRLLKLGADSQLMGQEEPYDVTPLQWAKSLQKKDPDACIENDMSTVNNRRK